MNDLTQGNVVVNSNTLIQGGGGANNNATINAENFNS